MAVPLHVSLQQGEMEIKTESAMVSREVRRDNSRTYVNMLCSRGKEDHAQWRASAESAEGREAGLA